MTWVSIDTKSKQSINLEKLLMTAEEWEHIKVREGGGGDRLCDSTVGGGDTWKNQQKAH